VASLNHYRGGEGEPLVLIHGIGSRWQMWEPVLEGLVAHRDVIALDLPGFGVSPMPRPGRPRGATRWSSWSTSF
jgi:pimeloyl-ACP methyl ester carboxylesterase